MADNVISIKLVDESGPNRSAPSPFPPPAPSGGQSYGAPPVVPDVAKGSPPQLPPNVSGKSAWLHPFMVAIVQKLTDIHAAVLGGNAPTGAHKEQDEKEKRGAPQPRSTIDKTAGAANAVMGAFAKIGNVLAMSTQKESEAAVARIRNDEGRAKIAEIEKRTNQQAALALAIPMVGERISALIQANANLVIADKMAPILIGQAFRDRGRELARFDPRIAMAGAIGDVGKQKRDIGEAAIIGDKLADVEMKQQQLDRVNQQIGILKKSQEAIDQIARTNATIAERQNELENLLRGVDANTAAMVRKLGDSVRTPFELLEERGRFSMPDDAQVIANQNQGIGNAPLDIPLLNDPFLRDE